MNYLSWKIDLTNCWVKNEVVSLIFVCQLIITNNHAVKNNTGRKRNTQSYVVTVCKCAGTFPCGNPALQQMTCTQAQQADPEWLSFSDKKIQAQSIYIVTKKMPGVQKFRILIASSTHLVPYRWREAKIAPTAVWSKFRLVSWSRSNKRINVRKYRYAQGLFTCYAVPRYWSSVPEKFLI